MPIFDSINNLLPSFPTYTILFLPQMPLRLPPPIVPALSFATIRASMSGALHMLPENALGVAVSVLAVAVGLGAAKSRYRFKQIVNSNRNPNNIELCPDTQERKMPRNGSRDEHALDVDRVDFQPLQIPTAQPHHPIQLMTPPLTPPVRPKRTLLLVPQEPRQRYSSSYPAASPSSTTFSLDPVPAQSSTKSSTSSASTSTNITTQCAESTATLSPDDLQVSFSNPLPPNLIYSNTNYATLLLAQKLITYERNRRATLEAEARTELGALLRVYWSGVKARRWDMRRREGRRKFLGVGSEGEGRMADGEDKREEKEERDVKESLRVLQRRVMSLREERVPYEDVLYPSPPPGAFHFENGKLATSTSNRISPSHFISILTDPQVALNVEEVDVALGLWAGWVWDVEEEWHMEVKHRQQDCDRMIQPLGHGDNPSSAPTLKERKFPKLRELTVSTVDVPLGLLFERVGLTLRSLEAMHIRIEDHGKSVETSSKVSGPTLSPNSSTPNRDRFGRRQARASREERRKEEPRQRVARCLEGLEEFLQRPALNLEMTLPESVEDAWTKPGSLGEIKSGAV